MRECWEDGALRAYLDRELPAAERLELAAHLEECEHCRVRSLILAARAKRVMELVGGLGEPEAMPAMARPVVRMSRRRYDRWIAVAAAIAAAWAALLLLMPKRVQAPPAPAAVETAPAAVAPAPEPVEAAPGPEMASAPLPLHAPPIHRRSIASAAPHATLAGFVPLDDEPIDAGVVMRVALAQGHVQADVLYSPDGRPRAYRLVSGTAGK